MRLTSTARNKAKIHTGTAANVGVTVGRRCSMSDARTSMLNQQPLGRELGNDPISRDFELGPQKNCAVE